MKRSIGRTKEKADTEEDQAIKISDGELSIVYFSRVGSFKSVGERRNVESLKFN